MRSIQNRILLYCALAIAVLSVVMGSGMYASAKRMIVSEIESRLESAASEAADYVSLKLSTDMRKLTYLASGDVARSMDWAIQRDELTRWPACADMLEIAVVDRDGVARYVDGETLNLSDRDYIRKALAGRHNFSNPLLSRKTGGEVIMAAAPIISEGGVRGALIGRIDAGFLSELIASKGYGEDGYAYILDDEGTVLAHPVRERIACNVSEIAQGAGDDGHGLLAFFEASRETESGCGRYRYNGDDVYMGHARIPGTEWRIYVGANKEEVLSRLDRFNAAFAIGMAIAAIASLAAAWKLSLRFSEPIVELERLFTNAANGDLTIRAVPRAKDELGRAAASLNLMMDRIRRLTYYDPLTGLPNIGAFASDIALKLDKRSRDKALAVAIISADRFRQINDLVGYSAGDGILAEAASRVFGEAAVGRSAYRGAGDEFIVVFDMPYGRDDAERYVERLLSRLSDPYQVSVDAETKSVSLTFSAGLAAFPDHGARAAALLDGAKFASHYAKDLGGNRMEIYSAEVYRKDVELRELEQELPAALDGGQLYMEYQPIVDLETGAIAEVEALMRWKHPDRGLVNPEFFIAAAEKTGVILRMGSWMLDTVCAQGRAWLDAGLPPVRVSVNISAREFESPDFISVVKRTLERYGLPPETLQLELTERTIIERIDESAARLEALRAEGLRISIDDFGIGYSSLSYLVRLPVDTLKIDKSFIQNLGGGHQETAIVTAILAMGAALGLTVVTEGIETEDQLAWLRVHRCDLGQGFLLCMPQAGDSPLLEESIRNGAGVVRI